MELRSTFAKIKPDQSLEANLMRAWLKGDATQDEWATGVAVSESGRCGSVSPRVYAQMPQAIRNYCQSRSEHRMNYDYAIAKRMGEWFDSIQQAWEFNLERLEHYMWAADRTNGAGTADAHKIIAAARDRFGEARLPADDIRLCLFVKKMDAEAREKSKRGA